MKITLDKKIIVAEADGITVAQVTSDLSNGKVQVTSHLLDGDTVVKVDSYIYEKEEANEYWATYQNLKTVYQMEFTRRGIDQEIPDMDDVLYTAPVIVPVEDTLPEEIIEE